MTWVSALRGVKGNKVGMAIEELHRVENDLVIALLNLADQQKVDHEIFHVARDIAGWSRQHVSELARVGQAYGLDLDADADDEPSLLGRVKQKGSELTGRFHEPGLPLLADLRHVHRTAAGASLDWEILAQTAQALKDTDLLDVAQRCHPETLRQMRWANAKLKETSAQVMVTG
ncbi:hypothetical protein SAMN04487968_11457 [Nocardioides terrae]|uniref:Ferritin-like metal-binding protein YciE n=1 Tax=Nocardioides terrae TaxID=574651 RepID=A0A1I1N327_9ACTN|nr:hypothetical protein [Nocardioides terrae]SFC91756.1 hypothetical protein SAMN04487968_11457 [Nocardioides terrae]